MQWVMGKSGQNSQIEIGKNGYPGLHKMLSFIARSSFLCVNEGSVHVCFVMYMVNSLVLHAAASSGAGTRSGRLKLGC